MSSTAALHPLRIVVADDHEVVRVAIRHALTPLAPAIDWREAPDAATVERELERDAGIDLALVDLHMPGAGAPSWIAQLRARHPTVPLIVLSADESPALLHALIGLGIAGFIPKSDSAAVILHAVRLVLSGGTYAPLRLVAGANGGDRPTTADAAQPAVPPLLTARQADVLHLLARGLPNKLIARELGLSEGTVKVHLLAVFRALAVHNRTQAVVAAQKRLRAGGLAAALPGVPGSL